MFIGGLSMAYTPPLHHIRTLCPMLCVQHPPPHCAAFLRFLKNHLKKYTSTVPSLYLGLSTDPMDCVHG